jgi:uncharacterized repeat protein (TIGR01451 family)
MEHPRVLSGLLSLVALLGSATLQAQFGPSFPMYVEGPRTGELVDMDGDGDLDLLLGTRGGPLVFTNPDGSGSFLLPEVQCSEEHVIAHGADLDSDGLADIIGSKQGSLAGIHVFRNDLQDGPQVIDTVSNTLRAAAITSADLDGDDDLDVVFALTNGQLAVALNTDGHGDLGTLDVIGSSTGCTDLRMLDVDGDGLLDIAWANAVAGTLTALPRLAGGWDAPVTLSNDGPACLADLNGDGLLDVACVTSDSTVQWRQGLGGWSGFGALQPVAGCASRPSAIEAGDIDADGDIDLVWALDQPAVIQCAANTNGTGSFGPVQDLAFTAGATTDLLLGPINGDASVDLLQLSTGGNQVLWLAGLVVPGGRIVGRVFNDRNGDGVFNGTDHGLANVLVTVDGSHTTWTNAAGLYWFDLDAGTYTVETPLDPLWNPTSPSQVSAPVTMMATTTGIDFGWEANGSYPSVSVQYTGSEAVCSYLARSWVQVANQGNQVGDIRLVLALDPLAPLAGAEPQPDSINGGNAYWTFRQVVPGQARAITLGALMPDVSHMGDTLHNVADAALLIAGSTVATAQATFDPLLLSSYDPNDKLVMPAGAGPDHLTAFGERMVYTIRFQNTGNFRAGNVVLVDTLDTGLDLSSLEVLAMSHVGRAELHDGVLRFIFERIMLPDSTSDPLGSQGFVRFALHQQEGLPEGRVLANTAHIFFDLNPAIVTNTVFNTLTAGLVGIDDAIADPIGPVRLVPNPAMAETELVLDEPPAKAYQVFLMDAAGRAVRFWQAGAGTARVRMPLPGLEQGVYVARVRTMDGGYDRAVRLVVGR